MTGQPTRPDLAAMEWDARQFDASLGPRKTLGLLAWARQLEATLERIASVPCQVACETLAPRGISKCVTCIARAALRPGDTTT